jgi:hypothetical protein
MEKYSKMIDEIVAKGEPVADTLIGMLELASRFKVLVKKHMIPTGNGITQSALRKRDKEGIKSQKHILKEWDKRFKLGTFAPKLGTVHKSRTKCSRRKK